jgi:hypothetical protein
VSRIGSNSAPITEDMIHEVVDFLHKYPELIRDAKKQATTTEWLAKFVLAELVNQSDLKSHAAKESWAMTQDLYQNAVKQMTEAEAAETHIKAKFAANELIASLFQTQSANFRSTKV